MTERKHEACSPLSLRVLPMHSRSRHYIPQKPRCRASTTLHGLVGLHQEYLPGDELNFPGEKFNLTGSIPFEFRATLPAAKQNTQCARDDVHRLTLNCSVHSDMSSLDTHFVRSNYEIHSRAKIYVSSRGL